MHADKIKQQSIKIKFFIVPLGILLSSTGSIYAYSQAGGTATPNNDRHIAIGQGSVATTPGPADPTRNAIAIGFDANASQYNTVAIGRNAEASGVSSTAVGHDSNASGTSSSAYGDGATASNTNATATGTGATASGYESTATGANSTASGLFGWSTATGANSTASGNARTAT